MSEFKVYGPLKLKAKKCPGAWVLETDDFWDHDKKHSRFKDKTGVYVFAICPSGSPRYIPYYVGKATKSFDQEVFQSDKIVKYHTAFYKFAKRSAALFFVVSPTKRGPVNARHIKQIEDNFIDVGFLVNPHIENKQGVKQPNWSISGVIRSRAKRQSSGAKAFSEMFKLTAD